MIKGTNGRHTNTIVNILNRKLDGKLMKFVMAKLYYTAEENDSQIHYERNKVDDQKEVKINKVNAKLQERKKIIGEQNAKIKSLQSDFDQMKKKLQDAEQEILNKMEIELELEQKISNKTKTIEKVKIEFEAKFKEDHAKLEMANDDILRVKNAKIESLQSDFDQMKEIELELEQVISNKTFTIEEGKIEFEAKLKEDHAKLEMANDDIKVKNAIIETLNTDFHQMKEKLQDAEQEISNKTETIKNIFNIEFDAKFKEDRAKLEMANDDIKVKNAEIESLKSDFHQMKEKLQDAEQKISNKTETIEKDKIEFEAKLKEDHAKLEMANDDIKVKNAEIESLKIDAKNQLELNAVTEKSQIEIRATLKDNLGKTTKKLVTAQNFIEEKNSELLKLNRLHEAEREERKTKEAEIATLKINLSKWLNKWQKTEIGLKEDQKMKESDIVQLKANIDTLTKDLYLAKTTCVWEDHDSKCHVKGAIDENLKKEVENLKKKLKDEQKECKCSVTKMLNSDLQKKVSRMKRLLDLREKEIRLLNDEELKNSE
jgi:chromosome segregation ATPase